MVHVKFGSNLDTLVPFFNSNRQILAEKAKKLMINEKQLGNGERAEVENLGATSLSEFWLELHIFPATTLFFYTDIFMIVLVKFRSY